MKTLNYFERPFKRRTFVGASLLFLLLCCCLYIPANGQQLSATEADSIKALVCQMEAKDQEIRDSFIKAEKERDFYLIEKYSTQMREQDSVHFVRLEAILRTYGFPCASVLGKGSCIPSGLMIHWSKSFPDWFNKPELVALFKQEIRKNHLPLSLMDISHYMFVYFTAHDLSYFEVINHARKEYGLIPYTEKQFLKEEITYPINGR